MYVKQIPQKIIHKSLSGPVSIYFYEFIEETKHFE
jgi:hypothetical protein